MISLLAAALLAQAPDATMRVATNEVVVDVVVRDKKGRLVTGLRREDFTISEDDAPQLLTGFRDASSGPPESSPAALPSASPVSIDRQLRLVTLVFDRMQPESRRLAKQAGLDLFKEELPPNLFYSVFYTDQKLRLMAAFTRDRAVLRKAVEHATAVNPSDFANDLSSLRTANAATQGGEGASEAAANSRGGPVDSAGMANESMNRMVRDMLESAETASREQQGRTSIFSLWGIVKEQQRLAGRKSVLYFSEGLQLPNSVRQQFQSLVSAANRANVSLYTIDARGLSLANDNALGNDLMQRNARVSQGYYRGTSATEAVSREQVMQFDRAEDAIRANQQVALAELAESTGGFLIANTNDFRQPLRRLAEDLASYYELTYRPANTQLDGRFRAVTVKVNRAEVKVQARNGYFALPAAAVQPYEVPLLNALAARPLPRAFDYRAALVKFRPRADGRQQAVLVFDLPLEAITFRENEQKTAYRTHVSVLALLKDELGQVVERISRDVPLEEPVDRLSGFRQGRFIVTRPVNLMPGRYTLESAVVDRMGEKAAARRTAVVMTSRAAGTLTVSGLTLLRRGDKAPPAPEADDPFVVDENRVVPTLVDTVPRGPGKMLSLYFVVYPPAGAEKPKLTVEFWQGEKLLGGGSPELPAVKADGRIPYIANTPLDSFVAGAYEVRVTVEQAGIRDRQSLFLNLE
jgi:VWFA-related protein